MIILFDILLHEFYIYRVSEKLSAILFGKWFGTSKKEKKNYINIDPKISRFRSIIIFMLKHYEINYDYDYEK